MQNVSRPTWNIVFAAIGGMNSFIVLLIGYVDDGRLMYPRMACLRGIVRILGAQEESRREK